MDELLGPAGLGEYRYPRPGPMSCPPGGRGMVIELGVSVRSLSGVEVLLATPVGVPAPFALTFALALADAAAFFFPPRFLFAVVEAASLEFAFARLLARPFTPLPCELLS